MDNRYQGQGQFGQNQQMPNQQMPNQQMPNQQMPNQYGQGVNPNIYNMGTPNMQPNGQNIYGQNMYSQNMYGQNMYGFNNPIPPMDPVAHAEQVNKAKKKKKIFIGALIAAGLLGIVGFVVGIIFVIGLIFKTYDVDDYNEVADACEEVLDIELEKLDEDYFDYYYGYDGYNVVEFAMGSGTNSKLQTQVIWMEFESEGNADSFYLELTDELEKDFEDIKDEYSSNSFSSGFNTTKASLATEKQRYINAVLQNGSCIMVIYMNGDKDKTEDLYDDLLDELD